jgi:hypothetical protein
MDGWDEMRDEGILITGVLVLWLSPLHLGQTWIPYLI